MVAVLESAFDAESDEAVAAFFGGDGGHLIHKHHKSTTKTASTKGGAKKAAIDERARSAYRELFPEDGDPGDQAGCASEDDVHANHGPDGDGGDERDGEANGM
eukprot:6784937-Pyramimonas_sp.AAC.1